MAQSFMKTWENITRRKFVRVGLPFIIFVAGGSFFLKQFTSLRYEFRKMRKLSKEEAEALGLKVTNIEAAEQKMLKEIEQMDVDRWENVRGPRPWEDSKTVQDEQRLSKKQSEDARG